MMESMLRALAILLLVAGLAAGGAFIVAGRTPPPSLSIDEPQKAIGQVGTLQVTVTTPGARLSALTVQLEQDGRSVPLFRLEAPGSASITEPAPDQLRITRPLGKPQVPELQSGAARIVVSASRQSFLNLRTVTTSASKDIQVRLEPPLVSVSSTHHYVNHGGSEMVVYRATPPDVVSGVRVGDVEFPGYPASGAGIANADPALKVAFFALLHDQDLTTPIAVFARDEAGNQASAPFVDRVFPKPFRKSRIAIDDRFLERVVPPILQQSPELKLSGAPGDLLAGFLQINGELRRANAEQIGRTTGATTPSRLWSGPFVQLGNSQVEAGFADHRTYVYNGKDVDQQVHLGFDLAVTAAVPIASANAGRVVHAGWLGIYGNCVIVDHGLGVASLYAHLSSIDVKAGDPVAKGQLVGRSGMTGLAGGDHLHFSMLVNGQPVNPVEWWDPHWVDDRVERKLKASAAGGV
jgi:murein DD-endopeptidase MepM/ murein hydrolase activator NlpD